MYIQMAWVMELDLELEKASRWVLMMVCCLACCLAFVSPIPSRLLLSVPMKVLRMVLMKEMRLELSMRPSKV